MEPATYFLMVRMVQYCPGFLAIQVVRGHFVVLIDAAISKRKFTARWCFVWELSTFSSDPQQDIWP